MKFFNNVRAADAQLAKTNNIGTVTRAPEYATRVAPGRWLTYEPKHVNGSPEIDPKRLASFRRAGPSYNDVACIVKDLLMTHVEMTDAPSEVAIIEVALQVSKTARAMGRDALYNLFAEISPSRVMRALSMMKSHDGDVERAFNAEWEEWQKHLGHRVTPEKAALVGQGAVRYTTRTWGTAARRALYYTEQANQIGAHAPVPANTPVLVLKDDKNKTVTYARINTVDPE